MWCNGRSEARDVLALAYLTGPTAASPPRPLPHPNLSPHPHIITFINQPIKSTYICNVSIAHCICFSQFGLPNTFHRCLIGVRILRVSVPNRWVGSRGFPDGTSRLLKFQCLPTKRPFLENLGSVGTAHCVVSVLYLLCSRVFRAGWRELQPSQGCSGEPSSQSLGGRVSYTTAQLCAGHLTNY